MAVQCGTLGGTPPTVHDFTELGDEADGNHVLPNFAIEGQVVHQPQQRHHEHWAVHRYELEELLQHAMLHASDHTVP